MHSSVITFPGSNCDRDMDVALKKFGFKNKMEEKVKRSQLQWTRPEQGDGISMFTIKKMTLTWDP